MPLEQGTSTGSGSGWQQFAAGTSSGFNMQTGQIPAWDAKLHSLLGSDANSSAGMMGGKIGGAIGGMFGDTVGGWATGVGSLIGGWFGSGLNAEDNDALKSSQIAQVAQRSGVEPGLISAVMAWDQGYTNHDFETVINYMLDSQENTERMIRGYLEETNKKRRDELTKISGQTGLSVPFLAQLLEYESKLSRNSVEKVLGWWNAARKNAPDNAHGYRAYLAQNFTASLPRISAFTGLPQNILPGLLEHEMKLHNKPAEQVLEWWSGDPANAAANARSYTEMLAQNGITAGGVAPGMAPSLSARQGGNTSASTPDAEKGKTTLYASIGGGVLLLIVLALVFLKK
ncbi:hypothetical protein GCM10023185_13200 [Hymenobacter saemangeumensis]|uniref:DUF937 domain-containing protein n=1 Tax=Hymenobacter saemangeumensis TaxID=1084522 RepID=A0ABP8I7H2_9BACT